MEMTDKSVYLSGLRGRPPSWHRPTSEAITAPHPCGAKYEQPHEYSTDPAPLVIWRVAGMGQTQAQSKPRFGFARSGRPGAALPRLPVVRRGKRADPELQGQSAGQRVGTARLYRA